MFGRHNDIQELIAEMREESQERQATTNSYLAEMREEGSRRDEEWKRRDEEMREFMREILLRNEKVYTAVIAQLEENTARVRENTEETRAQTQALMRMIDRLDGNGGAAAAA